ncbi:hypothetical protein M436DRAFT_79291 [Aureobasidium namibiae CBS 147.97]|uniref:Uncharacterized protein n=1 Tax=Aureobasidium namibiae CBS 147.97 TaxID=1043004 RepID=A0A074XN76_9PEZI
MACTFFHSTSWKFLEPDELITTFDQMVQDANVRCTYMLDKQMFRIEFPEPGHEQIYFEFMKLCKNYIETHRDGPQDAMSDPKIFRPAETGGNANAEDELEELLREDDVLDDEPLIEAADPSSEDEQDKPFWSSKNPKTNIALVLPDRLLQEIAQDTTCSLELSVEKACIYIGNASENKIQTVTKKLDNIERNWHRPRIDSHFVRMEKESDGVLQLHRLQYLKDGTLLQTLTPEHMKLMLPRQRVVRLMRRDTNGRLEIFSTQSSEYAHDATLAQKWGSLPLPHFLKEGMHDLLVTSGNNAVEAWVQGTIDSAPDESDLLSRGIEAVDLGEQVKPLDPVKVPFVQQEQHPVQDLWILEDERDSDSRPNSFALVDAEVFADPNILIDFEGRPPSSYPTSHATESVHTPAPSSIAAGSESLQARVASGIKFTDKPPKAQWENIPPLPVVTDYSAQSTAAYTGDVTAEPFPPLGTQGPRPRVQRLQPSSTPVAPPGLSTRRGQYSQAVLSQSAEPTDVVERLQIVDEVASRKYYHTTAHRKPKSKAKGKGKSDNSSFKVELPAPDWDPRSNKQPDVPDQKKSKATNAQAPPPTTKPNPLVLPPCSKDVLQILDIARAFRGHLDMEIFIGRILLEGFREPEAREFAASKPMHPIRMIDGIKEHLSSDPETILHFVERLTTTTTEACQIPTPQLFHQDAIEECWYEFHCEDKYHNQFILKVKGPEDATIDLIPVTIGQVFFHYPKRKWDACFVVKGRKPYTHRRAVKEFMERLSAEVRNSKDERLVDLRFRVTSDLKIHSAYTKKRLSFSHINNDRITLHLTEVQDLIRGWMGDDTSLHQFASRERAEMIAAHRLWFEAKISVSAESFFDQNLKIKTGDDAAWEAKDVLDDRMLSDIQNVVDKVVIRMDGVGVLNKGWRGSEEDMAELEAFEQGCKKEGRPGHW